MRAQSLFVLALTTTLGCNAITGVDDLELVDCVQCDSGAVPVDASVVDAAPDVLAKETAPDTSVPVDAPADDAADAAPPDAGSPDAVADASDADSGGDTSDASKFCTKNLDCDDGNGCTDDVCQVLKGLCTHATIDKDGDGQSPTSAGACGLDCYDGNKDVFSKQTAWFTAAYTTAAGTTSFDYDCSGAEEPQYTTLGKCLKLTTTTCSLTQGWSGTAVPACGKSATWISSCVYLSTTGTCIPGTASRVQACH